MAKNKILLGLVSLWVGLALASRRAPASDLYLQAEQIQKNQGDKQAIEYLWKNSEKLERPELMYLARLLVKQKDFKEILRVSEIALAKNPQDAEFLTFQGKAYLETRKDKKGLEKAQESLRSAIEINPKFEPAYLILDDYYERQDELNKTLKRPLRFLQTRRLLFEDLIQHLGEQHLYAQKLCHINTLDGVNDQALKHCRKALQLQKDDVTSQLNLAQVYKQTGEKDLARNAFKEAVKNPKRTNSAFEFFGLFLEEEKNFSEGYLQYQACVKAFPKADSCWRGIGSTSAALKKWQESYESFQKLCRKDRKWSGDVRKASALAKELGVFDWAQKLLELSLNCNI